MDMESAQVCRLLELISAMSSAQEQATGNGKLDMSGIMAALALAQKEEMTKKPSWPKVTDGGQSSFLHGSYQKSTDEKSSTSSFVRAEYVKETTISEDESGQVEKEGRKGSFLYSNERVKHIEHKEKESEGTSKVTGIQISSKKSSDNLNLNQLGVHVPSDVDLTRGGDFEGRGATVVESDSDDKINIKASFLHNKCKNMNDVESDNETSKFGRKVAGYKAAFESMTSESSSSSPPNDNSPPAYKKPVLPIKTVKLYNNGQNNPSASSLGSSQGVASFLTKHQTLKKGASEEELTDNATFEENKSFLQKNTTNKVKNMMETNSEEHNKVTGIGNRKALFEKAGNDCKVVGKETIQSVNNEPKKSTSKLQSMNTKPVEVENSLPNLLDRSDLQVSEFLAKVSELSAEKEKKTGNGKLDMTELAAALSSVADHGNTNSAVKQSNNKTVKKVANHQTSSSSQQKKKAIETVYEKQFNKTESSFSCSETVTSSSTKTQLRTKKSSFDSTPSNLANAKTSFLQSIISQSPTANNEQLRGNFPINGSKDLNNGLAFIPEKNSVISELKNMLDDDPTQIPNPPKRSFNSTPKGFQAPDLSGQKLREGTLSQISSNDPMVKKIVYNQYREMLKSYTNTN